MDIVKSEDALLVVLLQMKSEIDQFQCLLILEQRCLTVLAISIYYSVDTLTKRFLYVFPTICKPPSAVVPP